MLSAEDIQALQAAKIETVSGARLEPDDVGEDQAAQAVARAVAGPGLTLGDAFTGRCNIFAEGHGLAVIDDRRVDRLNLLDEAMTLGTVAPPRPGRGRTDGGDGQGHPLRRLARRRR